jgi:hypothetical protein
MLAELKYAQTDKGKAEKARKKQKQQLKKNLINLKKKQHQPQIRQQQNYKK